jgi:RNA polymerase sigma factor (sigma-70 family)
MADTSLTCVVRHLRTLAARPGADPAPDSELLIRFIEQRDEAAFAALLRRHGAMVLSVCQGVLGQVADAEDAFQATFLLLARRGAAIRRRESVAGWLYRVAYRVALKARVRAATRRRHEALAPGRDGRGEADDLTWRELRHVLYEELDRLPERYRAPLLLHYLEGKTQEETARQLGWAKGTLKGRLERARVILRARLTRRGLAPGAALLATVLCAEPAAAVPAALLGATARAASAAASGGLAALPARLAGLVERGMPAAGARVKVLALLVAASVALAAAGVWAAVSGKPREAAQAPASERPAAKPKRPASPHAPAHGRHGRQITVTGRIRGADGKPVAHAHVALVVEPKRPILRDQDEVLGQAEADSQGRFHLKAALAAPLDFWEVRVVAGAQGHGLAWRRLGADVERADAVLTLPPEQVVHGQLVDVQGQPAVRVKVFLVGVGKGVRGRADGIFLPHPPPHFLLWPGPATTDDQGRFTFHGVNRDSGVLLMVRDERFAPQGLRVGNDVRGRDREIRASLAPAHWLEGRVLAEDTGKPVPYAGLAFGAADSKFRVAFAGVNGRCRADGHGRFRVSLPPGKWYAMTASAPAGRPYLTPRQTFEWPRGAVRHTRDIRLPRGVLVRGKVTEKASGRPVAGAGVQYMPCVGKNLNVRNDVVTGWQAMVLTGPDGMFQIVVEPGAGHLLVSGPTQDFIHREIGFNRLREDRPGGQRYYPDGLVELDLPAKTAPKDVTVVLRRGVTVQGRLLGPKGQPVDEALMFHRLNIAGFDLLWRWPVKLTSGRFAVRGCDPAQTYPVYFLDPEHHWGAVAQISGKQAGAGPVTVKLARCGRATVRFLDAQGKPRKDLRISPTMVITPGANRYDVDARVKGLVVADEELLANLDRRNYWDLRSDAQGRTTYPALIPGVTYRLGILGNNEKYVFKKFKVEAGKTRDLGDIVVPRSR